MQSSTCSTQVNLNLRSTAALEYSYELDMLLTLVLASVLASCALPQYSRLVYIDRSTLTVEHMTALTVEYA